MGNEVVRHWMLKAGAEQTACGEDAADPQTVSLLVEYVTCPNCKLVLTGYIAGRVYGRSRAASPAPDAVGAIPSEPSLAAAQAIHYRSTNCEYSLHVECHSEICQCSCHASENQAVDTLPKLSPAPARSVEEAARRAAALIYRHLYPHAHVYDATARYIPEHAAIIAAEFASTVGSDLQDWIMVYGDDHAPLACFRERPDAERFSCEPHAIAVPETEWRDEKVVREIYEALNVRWRDVLPGDRFESANRDYNRALTEILATFRNICTSNKIDLDAVPA